MRQHGKEQENETLLTYEIQDDMMDEQSLLESEDDVREKQLVSSLHANVASQLQRSQDTLIRTERNPQHTVVVAFAKSAAQ